MTALYPDFYQQFHCTADACPITCCQEWKISVDDATASKWKTLSVPAEVSSCKTFSRKTSSSLYACTRKQEGSLVITLDEDHRCPFLSKNRLCHLVLAYGDSVLSETCTDFPREFHTFPDHREASLMPCCPAVIDLLCQTKKPVFPDVSSYDPLFYLRQQCIRLMQDESFLPEEALLSIFYIVTDLSSSASLNHAYIKDCFSDLTIAELLPAIRAALPDITDTIAEDNELLLDLAVNYEKEGLYQNWLAPLLSDADRLSSGMSLSQPADADRPLSDLSLSQPADADQLYSAWEQFLSDLKPYVPLLRSYLANEIFSDLLVPCGDLMDTQIRLQWIGLSYAAIRHSLFLQWYASPDHTLSYSTVRDSIVYLSRMTGYDDEDVIDYLQNSFASLTWDWGYFAMILAL